MASRKRLRDRIDIARAKRAEARASKVAPVEAHPVEIELRRAGSLGRLEHLAGIGGDHGSRAAFWRPYAALPARVSIEAGCVELRRMARLAAGAPTGPRP